MFILKEKELSYKGMIGNIMVEAVREEGKAKKFNTEEEALQEIKKHKIVLKNFKPVKIEG